MSDDTDWDTVASYYQEWGYEYGECDGPLVRPRVRRTVWKTKDGQYVKIKDMTDTHLTNTVRMLWRYAPARLALETLKAIQFEGSLHGECALDAAAAAVSELEDMTVPEFLSQSVPQWKYLLREARKRKLSVATEDWFESARDVAEDS